MKLVVTQWKHIKLAFYTILSRYLILFGSFSTVDFFYLYEHDQELSGCYLDHISEFFFTTKVGYEGRS
ncbi:MAG: hypothetical protein QMB11_13005 [Nonlabens sp.]|uniref:hypothetical protein n=1 Tax=Nonlabens sp. TaxID=1888209 RepID=UPI0035A5D355